MIHSKHTGYLQPHDFHQYGLEDLSMFQSFSDQTLGSLISLCKIFEFESGDPIIKRGEHHQWLYILLSGKLVVMLDDVEITVIHQRGDLFGEAALFPDVHAGADILAQTKAQCLGIDYILMKEMHTMNVEAFSLHLLEVINLLLYNRLKSTSSELVLVKKAFKTLMNSTNHEG